MDATPCQAFPDTNRTQLKTVTQNVAPRFSTETAQQQGKVIGLGKLMSVEQDTLAQDTENWDKTRENSLS